MSKNLLKLGTIKLVKYSVEDLHSIKCYIFHDEVGYKIERGPIRHNIDNNVDQLVIECMSNDVPIQFQIEPSQWQKIIDNNLFNQIVNFKEIQGNSCVGYCDRKASGFYCYESCATKHVKVKFPDSKVTIGVGDGSGNLFVKGSYEAIKAVQNMILERDMLKTEVKNLKLIIENGHKE